MSTLSELNSPHVSPRATRGGLCTRTVCDPDADVIELLADPARFAAAASRLLESRPEYNLLATVLEGTLSGRFAVPPPRFALVRDGTGEVVGVALRTPPGRCSAPT